MTGSNVVTDLKYSITITIHPLGVVRGDLGSKQPINITAKKRKHSPNHQPIIKVDLNVLSEERPISWSGLLEALDGDDDVPRRERNSRTKLTTCTGYAGYIGTGNRSKSFPRYKKNTEKLHSKQMKRPILKRLTTQWIDFLVQASIIFIFLVKFLQAVQKIIDLPHLLDKKNEW